MSMSTAAAKNAKRREKARAAKALAETGGPSSPQPGAHGDVSGGAPRKDKAGDWNRGEVVEPQQEVKPPTLKQLGTDRLANRITMLKLNVAGAETKGQLPHSSVSAKELKDPIDLKANYFLLEPNKGQTLYRYSVKIVEKTTSARIRRRILYLLFEQHHSTMNTAATDYHQTLFSTMPFQNHPTSRYYKVDYYGEGEIQPRKGKQEKIFTVVLIFEKVLPIQDLANFLESSRDPNLLNTFSAEEYVNAFNILLSRTPNQNPNVQHIGSSSFFDKHTPVKARQDLERGLEAYVGFVRSVRASQGQLLLNVNAKGSAFYKNLRMDWIIDEWSGGKVKEELEKMKKQCEDRNILERFIRGIRVQARHETHGSQRIYTVFGIAPWEGGEGNRPISSVVSFFEKVKDRNGKETGEKRKVFIDKYFKQKYPGIHKYREALVLNCGSAKDKILIPADCLTVLEGNIYRRLLEGEQTKPMQQLASVRPAENKERILNDGRPIFGIGAGDDSDNVATRFSFSVSSELFSVQGRALPSPDLDSGSPGVHETQNGEWDLKPARKFAKSCPAATWSYLDFTGRKSEITASKSSFIDDLRNGVKTWCPKLTESKAKIRTVDFPKADPKELEKILRQYRPLGIQPIHTDILFVGLRDDNADNYELLKYVAEVVVGIHTICTIKCKTAVVANLMLKCNLKLGGDNWVLSKKNRNQVPNFLSSTTMIVGADVTHPGPGSMDDVDSVAAVVANEDNAFNRYPASFRCQASKMEMIDQFDDMVAERLDHWKKSNGGHQYPSNIIIYRDGVSESQFEKVLELEYPQIESVIERLYNAVPQKIPGVMMLSVQKRHHTRFYPEKAAQKDENGNAYPGLLVDRGVTYADKYNWFLQSHRSILGTARPAHYVVLVNTINADMDEVHKATHWQCFLYGRCMKSISIHPAARLADQACTRARAYLHKYYVAGNQCNEKFDRSGAHSDAWEPMKEASKTATAHIRNSMFYI